MKKLPYKLPADEKMQVEMLADILRVPRSLIKGDLVKITQAMTGVVLYRHVERKEKQEIMALIHSLQNRALTGALVTKVSDVTVNPQWGEWSLTNEELESLVSWHKSAASLSSFWGANPGAYGVGASAWSLFKQGATKYNVIGLMVSVVLTGLGMYQGAEAERYSTEMERRKSYN